MVKGTEKRFHLFQAEKGLFPQGRDVVIVEVKMDEFREHSDGLRRHLGQMVRRQHEVTQNLALRRKGLRSEAVHGCGEKAILLFVQLQHEKEDLVSRRAESEFGFCDAVKNTMKSCVSCKLRFTVILMSP